MKEAEDWSKLAALRLENQSCNLAMPKLSQNLPDLAGLVLGWVEAKFCNKIRNVQLLPKTTRSPSFCTAPRREIFETVGEEVDSFAEISANIDGNLQSCRGSFSAVWRPNFASKYALESSRRDLRNARLCTVEMHGFFRKKAARSAEKFFQFFFKILTIFARFRPNFAGFLPNFPN